MHVHIEVVFDAKNFFEIPTSDCCWHQLWWQTNIYFVTWKSKYRTCPSLNPTLTPIFKYRGVSILDSFSGFTHIYVDTNFTLGYGIVGGSGGEGGRGKSDFFRFVHKQGWGIFL